MAIEALRTIKKYSKIYMILFKYAFINATAYRVSFVTEILVEVGFAAIGVVFFSVVYANITSIGGWTYEQMMFLVGLNIVTSELILGAFYIFGLKHLAEKIKDGEVDKSLVKPINSLFQLSLGTPYFTSFISIVPGIYLMLYAGARLGLTFDLVNFLAGLVIFICGIVLAYSILVLFGSLSFVFINAQSITSLGEELILEYKRLPHNIYSGKLRLVFYIFLPVIYVVSVPASTILHGFNATFLMLAIFLAFVFLIGAVKFWNLMIKNYSSASS